MPHSKRRCGCVSFVRDLKGAIEVVRREGIAIEDAPDLVEGQAVVFCAVAPGDGIFDQLSVFLAAPITSTS